MAEPEDYRLLIEREWADLHHSRIQEWSALGVVIGAHLGLVQICEFAADTSISVTIPTLGVIAGLLAAVFCVLGSLMTCRHRQLMRVKLGWIYQAEEQLGLIKTAENPTGVIPASAEMKTPLAWRGLALPHLLSSSGLIFCFYVVLLLVDITVAGWSAFL